jgi:hypothetical protein
MALLMCQQSGGWKIDGLEYMHVPLDFQSISGSKEREVPISEDGGPCAK